MKEYVSERGVTENGLEQARRECVDRERWRTSVVATPLRNASGGCEASELLIDLMIRPSNKLEFFYYYYLQQGEQLTGIKKRQKARYSLLHKKAG